MGMRMSISSGFTVPMITGILFILFFNTGSFAQDALKEMRSNVIEKIDGKNYYIHTIKKGQTLYMISKAYGADVNEVIRENPEVKEGIYAGQKIRIPALKSEEPVKKYVKPIPQKQKEPVNPPPSPTTPPAPPVPAPEPAPVVVLPCGQDTAAKRSTYHVALMIPLYLNEIDQINMDTLPVDPEETYNSFRFIQFYEGFRIATDSLQKSGAAINVYVYDAVKDTNATRRLISNPELKKMDMIIGLMYNRNFQMVAEFARKNNIPVVNPISERDQIITGNPMVLKVRPALKSQVPELAEYLSKSFLNDNIIIIRDVHFKDTESPESLRNACTDKSMNVHLINGYGSAFEHFSKEKENVLVVFSDNKVFTLELFTKLNEFRNDYKLTIIGLPKWDEMEGLEPEYLVNLKTHMMAPSFIDYDDPEVKKFVVAYQARYKTDPDILAFHGFDIAVYFLTALEKYGKAFDHCIPELRLKSLKTDFHFTQSPGNGFENQHWEIYKFENYRVKRVTME
jgi:ABC-type branched-subunit amino acid transport system substrate-binding protein